MGVILAIFAVAKLDKIMISPKNSQSEKSEA